MDDHFVSIKFLLDKHDPENFAKNYDITFYPTFVIIDTEGKEKIRTSGAPESPAAFNEMLAGLLPAENSWSVYEARYKSDPTFAEEYYNLLNEAHVSTKATEVYCEMFFNRSMEERFNAKNTAYYSRFLWDFNHPIIKFMMENEAAVDEVMGKGRCRSFLQHKSDTQVSRISRAKTIEDYNKCLELCDNNEILQTTLYFFYKESGEDIFAKNFYPVLKNAYKAAKEGDTNCNYYTFNTLHQVGQIRSEDVELSKKEIKLLLKYLDEISAVEKLDTRMKWFTDIQERYK